MSERIFKGPTRWVSLAGHLHSRPRNISQIARGRHSRYQHRKQIPGAMVCAGDCVQFYFHRF